MTCFKDSMPPSIVFWSKKGFLPTHLPKLALACWLFWRVSIAAGADPTVDMAIAQLAAAVYQSHLSNSGETSACLYRTLYWMNAAHQAGLDPNMALIRAQVLATNTASPGKLNWQLLTDFSLAEAYGLFTPANLTCLQGGAAPIATSGPSH